MRFASLERAIFAQIEVGAGVFPGGGATERLPLLVGRGRALEIVLGSDDFDAATAANYGWVAHSQMMNSTPTSTTSPGASRRSTSLRSPKQSG
ncbi:enoyl-CoA hydratase/isomerase family protein [Rhizobium beringeri]